MLAHCQVPHRHTWPVATQCDYTRFVVHSAAPEIGWTVGSKSQMQSWIFHCSFQHRLKAVFENIKINLDNVSQHRRRVARYVFQWRQGSL